MNSKAETEKDLTAEAKIKAAALKLFTQKGFDAVKTREIAAEAGINLALLNYYFRSKENLFELIMLENMSMFAAGISVIIHNSATTLDVKISALTSHYIDILIKNPNVPQFVLNEMQSHPEKITDIIGQKINIFQSDLMKQVQQEMQKGHLVNLSHPIQYFVNLLALTIFPFVSKPLLMKLGDINDEAFAQMMEGRKKMLPVWLKAMYAPKTKNE